MEFRILGAPEVAAGPRAPGVALTSPKQRTLLGALLTRPGVVVPAERLIRELWGDCPPGKAGNALQAHVSRLRQALISVEPERANTPRLVARGAGYLLQVRPEELDRTRFRNAVERGRALVARDPRAAWRQLRDALALWRGPALYGSARGPLCSGVARRLEAERLDVLELYFDCGLRAGRHAELVEEIDAVALAHPGRSRFQEQLALAMRRVGGYDLPADEPAPGEAVTLPGGLASGPEEPVAGLRQPDTAAGGFGYGVREPGPGAPKPEPLLGADLGYSREERAPDVRESETATGDFGFGSQEPGLGRRVPGTVPGGSALAPGRPGPARYGTGLGSGSQVQAPGRRDDDPAPGSSSPGRHGRQAEAESPWPGPGGHRPDPTAARPDLPGRQPDPTALHPDPNGRRPRPTAPRPGPSGRRPDPTGSRPSPNGHRPDATTSRPSPNGHRPDATTSRPSANGRRPDPSAHQPHSNGRPSQPTGAGSDRRQPAPDAEGRRPVEAVGSPEAPARGPVPAGRRPGVPGAHGPAGAAHGGIGARSVAVGGDGDGDGDGDGENGRSSTTGTTARVPRDPGGTDSRARRTGHGIDRALGAVPGSGTTGSGTAGRSPGHVGPLAATSSGTGRGLGGGGGLAAPGPGRPRAVPRPPRELATAGPGSRGVWLSNGPEPERAAERRELIRLRERVALLASQQKELQAQVEHLTALLGSRLPAPVQTDAPGAARQPT
ncbi:BTAD domain-containing putative transcriptional regulator [Streptomyces sp. NPDC093984]|uniref:BTAD domain-containing putative transcriptional regulator n=1 Tax=Streptomyces sp. NPDC093984 TaxID=3366052 RepID=UPI00382759AD